MTPEEWETLKQGGVVVGGLLGTAWAAWTARGRKEKRVPDHYDGPPDDSPRKITRKEWHDLTDVVSGNVTAIEVLRHQYGELAQNVSAQAGQFAAFGSIANSARESLARLEERFTAHVSRWEEGSELAKRDREEIMRRFDSLDNKLDRRGGRA
jgi:hypothetical protein